MDRGASIGLAAIAVVVLGVASAAGLAVVRRLWLSGALSDRALAGCLAALIPVVSLLALVVAALDGTPSLGLAFGFVAVVGVSVPLAVFSYRIAVPMLRDTRSVAMSSKPMRFGEYLEGASLPVRVALLAVLAERSRHRGQR